MKDQPIGRRMTSREKFDEYFEDLTGWEPSAHPDAQYTEDLWETWKAGRDSHDE